MNQVITPNDVVADALRSSIEEYEVAIVVAEKELADAQARVDDLKAQRAACELMLPVMEGRTGTRAGSAGMHSHIRPRHLADCKTQRDGWRKIATLTPGNLVRPTDAAQLLVDARVGGIDVFEKARSNALTWMYNSHEWENIEEGTYRYLGRDGLGLREDTEATAEEECHEKPYQTDDGEESPHSSQESPVTPDALGQITV